MSAPQIRVGVQRVKNGELVGPNGPADAAIFVKWLEVDGKRWPDEDMSYVTAVDWRSGGAGDAHTATITLLCSGFETVGVPV